MFHHYEENQTSKNVDRVIVVTYCEYTRSQLYQNKALRRWMPLIEQLQQLGGIPARRLRACNAVELGLSGGLLMWWTRTSVIVQYDRLIFW